MLLLQKYQIISEMLRLITEVALEEDSDVVYFLWQLCDLRPDPIMTHAPIKSQEAVDTYLQGIQMVRSAARDAVKKISNQYPSHWLFVNTSFTKQCLGRINRWAAQRVQA